MLRIYYKGRLVWVEDGIGSGDFGSSHPALVGGTYKTTLSMHELMAGHCLVGDFYWRLVPRDPYHRQNTSDKGVFRERCR